MDPESLMQLAVDKARQGVAAGQSPFGCAILIPGTPPVVEHNTVLRDTDITAHAEMNALRAACRRERRIHLAGAVAASTCEPCPMCMAALHWARVETVYYGASIADAAAAGFRELRLPAAELIRRGGGAVRLVGGVLLNECRDLFRQWLASPHRQAY